MKAIIRLGIVVSASVAVLGMLLVPATGKPKDVDSPKVCAVTPDGEEICGDAGLTEAILSPHDGEIGPQFTVELGWGVYFYFNRSDIAILKAAGEGGAGGVVCAWTGVVGAAVCGAVAGVVLHFVGDGNIPYGYCLRIKYPGYDASLVQRSC